MFRSVTGMDLAAFAALLRYFEAAARTERAASGRTRDGRPRRRAPGGGRRPRLAACDRLLMTLLWLRIYPTYELLGYFFGLDKSNAHRNTAAVLAVLETLAEFAFDRPDADPHRRPLDSPATAMGAFPDVLSRRAAGDRHQGAADAAARRGFRRAEALLLDEEEGAHAQDAACRAS